MYLINDLGERIDLDNRFDVDVIENLINKKDNKGIDDYLEGVFTSKNTESRTEEKPQNDTQNQNVDKNGDTWQEVGSVDADSESINTEGDIDNPEAVNSEQAPDVEKAQQPDNEEGQGQSNDEPQLPVE